MATRSGVVRCAALSMVALVLLGGLAACGTTANTDNEPGNVLNDPSVAAVTPLPTVVPVDTAGSTMLTVTAQAMAGTPPNITVVPTATAAPKATAVVVKPAPPVAVPVNPGAPKGNGNDKAKDKEHGKSGKEKN